jgi:hypothetical protein
LIHVGVIQLGPDLPSAARAFVDDLRREAQSVETGPGTLDLVLVIGGSLGEPEFAGARTGRASKKMQICQVQVAVPSDVAASRAVRERAMPAVLAGVAVAEQWFSKQGIEFDSPFPPAEMAPPDASTYEWKRVVSLELPSRPGGYELSWIEALEDQLERDVAQADLGSLDGNEISADTATLFFVSSNPDALADLFIGLVQTYGIPENTWIVRYDADGNELCVPVRGTTLMN